MSVPVREFLGKSSLFDLSSIDLPDPVEHSLFYRYSLLLNEWDGKGDPDISTLVLRRASSSKEEYQDLFQGLLYGILAEAGVDSATKFFQLALSSVNDGWSLLVEQLKYFTFTKFSQLRAEPRERLFWLLDRLIGLKVKGCDGLVLGLTRQVRAGDRSSLSLSLVGNLTKLVECHLDWVLDMVSLVPYILYAFLRLLSEDLLMEDLRKRLCTIVLQFLYKRLKECSLLGRDLVRCLIEVSAISEIRQFWQWLLKARDDGVEPFARMLTTLTPRKYLAMRLTPQAEADLLFLLEQAPSSQQAFFLPLFLSKHCPANADDDVGALIVDLIRYVACYTYPSKTTQSIGIQRWTLVVALLKAIKTNYSAASAKLSLYIDWFCFDSSTDNPAAVELGMQVIVKSVVQNPNIAATLLEYLYLSRDYFYPPLAVRIGECIDKIGATCIQTEVIPSLNSLIETPMLANSVKELVKLLFPSSLAKSRLSTTETRCQERVDLAPGCLSDWISSWLHGDFSREEELLKAEKERLFGALGELISSQKIRLQNEIGQVFEFLCRLDVPAEWGASLCKELIYSGPISLQVSRWKWLSRSNLPPSTITYFFECNQHLFLECPSKHDTSCKAKSVALVKFLYPIFVEENQSSSKLDVLYQSIITAAVSQLPEDTSLLLLADTSTCEIVSKKRDMLAADREWINMFFDN